MNNNLEQPKKKGDCEPRRCGHCKQPGHTFWDCLVVKRVSDMLETQAMVYLRVQPLGYKLEHFLNNLDNSYLKILYKRICQKTMKKKEAIVYDDILEKFREMNIGYEGRTVRRTRIYSGAFRAAQSDGENQEHGRLLQIYLLSLHPSEVLELFDKIYGGNGEWIGRQTQIQQRNMFYALIAHTDMRDADYCIHCHFSEMNIGYRFDIYQFYLHTTREVTVRQNGMVLIIKNRAHFTKSIDLVLSPSSSSNTNMVDCAICMESKTIGHHIVLNCKHEFCSDCVGKHVGSSVKGGRDVICPLCRASVTKIIYESVEVLREMQKVIVL
jgi:hypothetical protein